MTKPEEGNLQFVGDKVCGFRFSVAFGPYGACPPDYSLQFAAFTLNRSPKRGQFCSFWENEVICICDFQSCNSLNGILYETLEKNVVNVEKGTIEGKNYTHEFLDSYYVIPILECLLTSIERAHNLTVSRTLSVYDRLTATDEQLQQWKDDLNNSGVSLYPDPNMRALLPLFSDQDAFLHLYSSAGNNGDGSGSNLAIIALLGVLCLISLVALLVVGYVHLKRHWLRKRKCNIAAEVIKDLADMEDIDETLAERFATAVKGFDTSNIKTHPHNKMDFRSEEVQCFDGTRVVITDPCAPSTQKTERSNDATIFYHANHLTLSSGQKYIACQGPLEHTLSKFIKMIVATGCELVVALGDSADDFREYIPKGAKPIQHDKGHIIVRKVDGTDVALDLCGIRQRQLVVECEGSPPHTFTQIQLQNWSPFGDADHPHLVLELAKLVQEQKSEKPTIVHCSDGVGRTATFLAFLEAKVAIERGERVNVTQIMANQRKARCSMIRNVDHYKYLYALLVCYFEEEKYITKDDRFKKIMNIYQLRY